MKTEKHIWTIGHSTRTLEEFLNLLKADAIEHLIDVRRFPGSRKFPQYNLENLERSILEHGMLYTHLEPLGGRRKASQDSKNTVWNHPSFRGYADYMETDDFQQAYNTLETLALQHRSTIMCSEAVWWRCHRSMIADVLKAKGWEVIHILGAQQHKEHPYTKPAKIINGQLSYHYNV
ncbi:DUF488 domain-containing protein [Gelidibacter salicanalis]|uniref:DUF488 domain-containing protein n=1 Tax=Gelidibacter salicanalis TaxID=291193 RepID=A0A5C7AH24_9FLAO|nr:DUF488 domain-containing protein [Gelidibacter salicanalis]TXE07721.1 DUF488 domain-containing protein [Gelidibacter salicanalis]